MNMNIDMDFDDLVVIEKKLTPEERLQKINYLRKYFKVYFSPLKGNTLEDEKVYLMKFRANFQALNAEEAFIECCIDNFGEGLMLAKSLDNEKLFAKNQNMVL